MKSEATAESDPYVGTLLAGKYAISARLGVGGMGAVYEAENVSIARKVAIKILSAAYAKHTEALERFGREARAATRIGHPNIVDVLDMGRTDEGLPFIVMERLEGEELLGLLGRSAPLQPAQAIDITLQVLNALGAAHAAGIIHRDLKPENVFLVKKGLRTDFVKIVDFGVAMFEEPADRDSGRLTHDGAVVGTPAYMSPEQASGRSDVDYRTDLYTVGVLLYEMLSARLPYHGQNYNEIIVAIATLDPPPLAHVAAWVPPDLASLVARAMARDPVGRFQSAAAFAAALEPFVDAVELEIPEPGAARSTLTSPLRVAAPTIDAKPDATAQTATDLRRPRTRLFAAAAGVALALAVALFVLLRGSGPDASARPARARTAPPVPAAPETAAAEARVLSLDVTSNVTGARVLLDGRSLGETPLHTVVPADPAEHVLRLEAEGMSAVERRIPLGAPVAISVDLSPDAPTKARSGRRGRKLIFDDDVY